MPMPSTPPHSALKTRVNALSEHLDSAKYWPVAPGRSGMNEQSPAHGFYLAPVPQAPSWGGEPTYLADTAAFPPPVDQPRPRSWLYDSGAANRDSPTPSNPSALPHADLPARPSPTQAQALYGLCAASPDSNKLDSNGWSFCTYGGVSSQPDPNTGGSIYTFDGAFYSRSPSGDYSGYSSDYSVSTTPDGQVSIQTDI